MKMVESYQKRAENTVRKGEIARNEQFLFFPQCFKRLVLQTRKNEWWFGRRFSLCRDLETTRKIAAYVLNWQRIKPTTAEIKALKRLCDICQGSQ